MPPRGGHFNGFAWPAGRRTHRYGGTAERVLVASCDATDSEPDRWDLAPAAAFGRSRTSLSNTAPGRLS
jgi:hypothetical protein